jgi:pyruvate carboxylase
MRNALGYALYPRVYEDYLIHFQEYSDISKLDSEVFLHGLNRGEECDVEIEEGKVLNIKLVGIGRVKENGYRTVVFELNGMSRRVEIKDNNFGGKVTQVAKANMNNPFEIGASIPGKVIKILVKEGDVVAENDPLIVIEAMKMETNIVSKVSGEIKSIEVKENDIVEDKQLLITIK